MKSVFQSVGKSIKGSQAKLGADLAMRLSENLKKAEASERFASLIERLSLDDAQSSLFLYLWIWQESKESLHEITNLISLDEAQLSVLEDKQLIELNGIYGVQIRAVVADYLSGRQRLDPSLQWFLTLEDNQASYELWKPEDKTIAKGLLNQPNVVIEASGSDFAEACAMMASVSEDVGRRLYSIDLSALENARFTADFHKICGEAATYVYIWGGAVIFSASEETMARTVLRYLSAKGIPAIVFSEKKTNYLNHTFSINLTHAAKISNGAFWAFEAKALGVTLDESTIEQLESVFSLGRIATRNALMEYKLLDRKTAGFTALAAISRKYTSQALNDYAKRIQPRYGWDDIILPPVTKQKLREVSHYISSLSRIEKDWSFRKRHNRGHGVTILLKGHSGTGKTMAAEVLAQAVGMDLYQVDLASVTSKYIGETQKNLSKIFAAAKQSAGVLFFDEGEMLFSKRSDVESSNDKYANLEVNFLLQEIESFDGVVIISTNNSHMIDSAFLRRIMFDIEFPRPSAVTRKTIWEKHLSGGIPLDKDVDLDFLATLPLSGGIIYNIVKRAAGLASAQQGSDRTVRMRDLLHGVQREYQKADIPIEREVFGIYWRYVSPEWEVVNVSRKARSKAQIIEEML